MSGIRVAWLLALSLAILAGSATAAGPSHPLDQALANRLTIRLADLPSGWEVHPLSKSSRRKCTAFKPTSMKAVTTGKAHSSFSDGVDLVLSEAGVVTTTALARFAYGEISSFARSCLREIPAVKGISVK